MIHDHFALMVASPRPGQVTLSSKAHPACSVSPVDGSIDVVVVSYNSSAHLRQSVDALAKRKDVTAIVVDNASSDGSLST